jgi:O-antigen ligase
MEHAHASSLALPLRRDAVASALAGVALAGGVAAADGGYFASSWAWTAVLTLVPATVLLVARPRTELQLLDVLLPLGLAALGVWAALSALWAPSATLALDEVARLLAYVGAVLLTLLVVRRRTVPHLVGGVLAGVAMVGAYALLTRLLPDRLGEPDTLQLYRLAAPVGYWNGLGVYLAMGTLLAVGVAARAGHVWARTLAAGAPVVLVTAQSFTFSRGAWGALAAGLVVAVAVGPRRLQLVVTLLSLAPWTVVAVAAAMSMDAITQRGSPLDEAADDGRALLGLVVLLAAGSALTGLALAVAGRRVEPSHGVRRAATAALVAAAALGVLTVWSQAGSPWSIADRAWASFTSPPRGGDDLTNRVLTLSSNGRIDLWRVAWSDARSSPLQGEGAGSYQLTWARERPDAQTVRDAHSLYVETVGELGLVGLALLLATLAVPVVAVVRARATPLAGALAGAYATWLAHAAVDWDWELAGVTVVALLCGCALVGAARRDVPDALPGGAIRIAAPVATGLLAAVALVFAASNIPLGRALAAESRADFAAMEREAARAERFAPWSSQPLWLRGRAELAQVKVAEARATLRRAVARDPGRWELWLDLAAATTGEDRLRAARTAKRLNPLEREIDTMVALAREERRGV